MVSIRARVSRVRTIGTSRCDIGVRDLACEPVLVGGYVVWIHRVYLIHQRLAALPPILQPLLQALLYPPRKVSQGTAMEYIHYVNFEESLYIHRGMGGGEMVFKAKVFD